MNGHDPYYFDLAFERALVATLCSRPKFYGIIGHALESDLMSEGPARLLTFTAQTIAKELGSGPSAPFMVIQRLKTQMLDSGKITADEIDQAVDYLDAAEDLGIPPEESLINELKPILRRRLQKDAARAGFEEFTNQGNFEKVVDMIHEANKLGVVNSSAGSTFGADSLDKIQEIRSMERLPTGIAGLDNHIGGLHRGGLGLFIAPTSGGKSMMLNHLTAYNLRRGISAIYITLELPEFIVMARLAANLTGLPINQIQENAGTLAEAKKRLSKMDLAECLIKEFAPGLTTVEDIKDWIHDQETKKSKKYDLIVIDYGDKLCAPKAKREYDHGLIVFQSLRYMAVEDEKYVWTASQSQRSTRESMKRLDMHHVADSAHKPRESDLVITLTSRDEGQMMEYMVAKNRTGAGRMTVGPWPTEFEIGRMTPIEKAEDVDWSVI